MRQLLNTSWPTLTFIVGCSALLFGVTSASADSYVCVADRSTGFRFDPTTKTWQTASFTTDRSKWIIRPPAGNETFIAEGTRYAVFEAGSDIPNYGCESAFTEAGFLFCNVGPGEFKMNNKTNRYLLTYTFGYWTDDLTPGDKRRFREGSDTPLIEIGRCNRLQ
jgi:hypothetical protein